jgi:hypothetical protein
MRQLSKLCGFGKAKLTARQSILFSVKPVYFSVQEPVFSLAAFPQVGGD